MTIPDISLQGKDWEWRGSPCIPDDVPSHECSQPISKSTECRNARYEGISRDAPSNIDIYIFKKNAYFMYF